VSKRSSERREGSVPARGSGGEGENLDDLLGAVRRTAAKLPEASPWLPTLEVLEEELEEGQPFFFKIACASSSRSKRETPVVAE
jgi:hypothetical protein